MTWCARFGFGFSEMEVKDGYKLVAHKSVFVKFPPRDRPAESLLVWTTTPWTLPANVAAAVNPERTQLTERQKGDTPDAGTPVITARAPRGVEVSNGRVSSGATMARASAATGLYVWAFSIQRS